MPTVEDSTIQMKLEQLNDNFLNDLNKVYQELPYTDFRIKFDSYMKTYDELCNSTSETSEKNGQKENSSLEFNKSLLLEVNNELEGLQVSDKKASSEPRTNYISWDEYFMSVAQLASKRSKDPSFQVGACIVTKQNKIVATGYNGMPNGVDDDRVPWGKVGSYLSTKYAYVVHAELNAILNCVLQDLAGCRVYVSLFPCNECAKAIIQAGIRHVIYLSDKHKEKDATKAAKIMFQLAGVTCEQYASLSQCKNNVTNETINCK